MLELDIYFNVILTYRHLVHKHLKLLSSWCFLNLKICAIKWKICSDVNGIKDSKEQMEVSNFISAKVSLWKYKKNYQSVFDKQVARSLHFTQRLPRSSDKQHNTAWGNLSCLPSLTKSHSSAPFEQRSSIPVTNFQTDTWPVAAGPQNTFQGSRDMRALLRGRIWYRVPDCAYRRDPHPVMYT